MRGIGDKLDKQTKIKILQERAFKYNEKFDLEEEKGLNPDEIARNLAKQQFLERHKDDKSQTLPFDENKKIIKVSGGTDFGFESAHKTLSETKTMYQVADKNFQQKKELKRLGQKDPDAGKDISPPKRLSRIMHTTIRASRPPRD